MRKFIITDESVIIYGDGFSLIFRPFNKSNFKEFNRVSLNYVFLS